MPTISVENYLKAIYHLEQQGEEGGLVKNKAIAEKLEISLPSVTSMLKSLADNGLVVYERYKGVKLSPDGCSQALNVIRKHRLIELFLVETLQYTWDEVHSEAELLEHAVSDKLAAKIDAYLGFPDSDPHGDPIPSVDGQVRVSSAIPLNQCSPYCTAIIKRVLNQSPELLRYLKELGLVPGSAVDVVSVQAFDGQMNLSVNSTQGETSAIITAQTASCILVLPQ